MPLNNEKYDKFIVDLLFYLALSLFLLNETFRIFFNKSALNTNFNLLFIIIGLLAIVYMFFKEYIDLRIIILALAITICTYFALLSGSVSISQYIKVIPAIFMPVLLTGIRLPENSIGPLIYRFTKLLNIICVSLVIVGICDYVSGASIQIFMAQHKYFDTDQAALVIKEHAIGIYRYYSFIGHPLTNALYLLIFYMMNILNNRYIKPLMNEYLIILITIIGLLLSGSRTALIAGLIMIVFLNNTKHKVCRVSLISILCAGLYSTPLFQKNLLQRFATNIADISEGRNQALTWVFNGYLKSPGLISGGGLGYSRKFTLMIGFINSFEYPFIMLAYDIGILTTILIYLIILLIPIYVFLKNRSSFILVFFILISLYANGFNSLANYADFMGQLCYVCMILLNLSYMICKTEGKELAWRK